MKRILKALSAFALSLVLILALAVIPVRAAENGPSGDPDGEYAGYLVMLQPAAPSVYSADPLEAATLMAACDERDELLMLAEDWNIYKAGSLTEIQSLVYSGQVEVVEPDYKAELFDIVPVEPDDPKLQRSQSNLVGSCGVNVRSAWEAGLTGKGVTVAVIDSGLNGTHEDAPAKIGRGRYYYYKEDPEGRYELTVNGVTNHYSYWSSGDWIDNTGHGSMVSGIIAAKTDNGLGIASIAPEATILPVRCFTSTEGHVGGYTSNLISGINYAVENGADIINMSWGIKSKSSTLQAAVDAAYQAGCILIAAAGNDGTVAEQYPAAWDNVISVGATDDQGYLCSYSQRVTSVDVCAPGGSGSGKVTSLGWTASNSYLSRTGTSFSAPAVAGAAALMLQADPTMTQGDFLSLLKATSHPVNTADGHTNDARYAGVGRIDIQGLLDAAGYAGSEARRTDDGFELYAGYHPTAAGGVDDVLALVAGYDANGHLLESHSAILPKSQHNNCAGSFAFQTPDIAEFKTFYLDPNSLSALAEPIIPLLEG